MKNPTIFYEKIGKRYKPSRTTDVYQNSMPYGCHLIIVEPNTTSKYYKINPAYAPMIAASKIATEKMCVAIVNKSKYKPVDGFPNRFEAPSVQDCITEGMNVLRDEAEKLLANPAVENAYDHFLLVCELTKEDDNVKL